MSDALPLLRDEIRVVRGADDANGWPSYILHDIMRNRFFHLGWAEFEVLSRWGDGDARRVAERVVSETTLNISVGLIHDLAGFLTANGLTKIIDDAGFQRLSREHRALRKDMFTWLLHHYLFVRIPLFRSDALITKLERIVRPLASVIPFAAMVILPLAGSILALHFERFLSDLPQSLTLGSAIAFALALSLSKMVHELGHAVTLKHFGGRVPTMGVALLVLFPVLYTDTNAGWFLTSRRQRMMVAMAGVAAEIFLSGLAVIVWSIAPEGNVRTATVFIATTALVGTLLVNASPIFKFDGYFVLSDYLNIPNLHERAFKEGRLFLRRLIFGGIRDVPYSKTTKFLIFFAFSIWAIRFVAFVGIALMVYLLAFKALGIILLIVEVWWFILRPVVQEFVEWRSNRLSAVGLRRAILIAGLIGGVGLLLLPWRSVVQAPAILQANPVHRVIAAASGRIIETDLVEGQMVREGDFLFSVDEAEQRQQRLTAELDAAEAVLRAERAQVSASYRSEFSPAEERVQRSLDQMAGLKERSSRATVTSPISGILRDVQEGLRPGRWVGIDVPIAVVVGEQTEVVSFAPEAAIPRIRVGAHAVFIAADPMALHIELKVRSVEVAAAQVLDIPMLAAVNGGDIPIWTDPITRRSIPAEAVYRIILDPIRSSPRINMTFPGAVQIDVPPSSLGIEILKHIISVIGEQLSF